MSVPGAFFEVTGKDWELVAIYSAIDANDGRLTASSSASLDLWQEMAEEWFKIHDAQVAAKALREAEEHLLNLQTYLQTENAALPDEMKVHVGDAARAWSNGMSNARRVLRFRAEMMTEK